METIAIIIVVSIILLPFLLILRASLEVISEQKKEIENLKKLNEETESHNQKLLEERMIAARSNVETSEYIKSLERKLKFLLKKNQK